MDCTKAQALRHAYLDGEIDPVDASALDAHLRGCVECAAAFRRDRELSAAIKLEVPRYRAPELLRARIRGELARRERWRFRELRLLGVGWNPAAIAASLMLAVIMSSVVTRSVVTDASVDRMADAVVAAHIRSLMAEHLIDVKSSDQHTVKPWFNGKLALSPPVPDLAAAGFPLVGGRLDYVDDHPVAALVYRRQQHVINVLVSAAAKGDGDARPAPAAERGYNLLRFTQDGMDFWIVSDLNTAELGDFAARVRAALSESAPS